MSETRQPSTTETGSDTSPPAEAAPVNRPRPGWRIDEAHSFGASDPATTDIVEPSDSESAAVEMSADDFTTSDELLIQLQQLEEQVHRRYQDASRREQRLSAQLAQLDLERRQARVWMQEAESSLAWREQEVARRNQDCEDREEACLSRELEFQARLAEFLQREQAFEARQAQLAQQQQAAQAEFERICETRQTELRNAEVEFQQQHESQTAALHQERLLLHNRIRFQEEHLQKLRDEFDAEKTAWLVEQQRLRALVVQDQEQAILRRTQLDQRRIWLQEMENSLDREHTLLSRQEHAGVEALEREQLRLATDRADWDTIQTQHVAQLQQRQQELQRTAENLEARQQRLERLRLELDETNRKTLEMRLAVEEACAQLAQAVGPEQARMRIELARAALSDHFRHARETLTSQTEEWERSRQEFVVQQAQFRAEQQTLSDWFAQRDEELRTKEAAFQQALSRLAQREQAWMAARDRWDREKFKAEAVIRDLLRQLESHV